MIHLRNSTPAKKLVVPGILASVFFCSSHGIWAQKPDPQPETVMTPQQTKDLFDSVDSILGFASKDTHLQIHHPVKREMMSRAEVTAFLKKQFDEDESVHRMERSELVLKKFGMLDRDFQLRPFLISLLTEQIAGFYDAKNHTMHMLNWVKPDEQKPVMAHELTHALQDQRVGMKKWSDPEPDGIAKNAVEDREHLQTDEAGTARSAVAEGQAMVVFVDYALKDSGQTVATAPGLADKMRDMQASSASSADSPIMSRAPLLLQQELLFPYTAGLMFESEILSKKGVDRAFGGTLDAPPNTSREILHPQEYLDHTPQPLLTMPDVHPLLDKEWAPYDVGVLGELDVRLLTEIFAGQELAASLAPQWNGGLYYAAQRRDATPEQKTTTKSIAFVYYSQWRSIAAAQKFFQIYGAAIPRKYRNVKKLDESTPGTMHFTTQEGDVILSLRGKGVFVSEGFDPATADTLEQMYRSVQSAGPVQSAQMTMHEPALQLASELASFGVMKAALPVLAVAKNKK